MLEILLLYQTQIFNAAHKLASMLKYLPVLVKILIVWTTSVSGSYFTFKLIQVFKNTFHSYKCLIIIF